MHASCNSFVELVKNRTSCRAYKTDPVPRGHIELMLEAARLAPSACNKQPWRFAVVTDQDTRLRLVNEAFIAGIPMKWAENAPVIIALGMERSLVTHKIAPKISGVEYPLLDLGIAGEHLVLQAEELGLGSCWIGWIKPKEVRQIVGWPRGIEPVSLITFGWPADGERKHRPRLSADEITKWI
ncbi:MAG: nitroreductase family protein [Kiritimatiellales bacterium]|nr:nitroreductase family protein [Kiritimatiellales bacterium]